MSSLRHVVFVKNVGDYWHYGYVDRNGGEETVRLFTQTLREALKKARSHAASIYYGTERRSDCPKEYPGPVGCNEGRSPAEIQFDPIWGYHLDGWPRIIVADDVYSGRWLDEADNHDKAKIIEITIDDAVRVAKKDATRDANMLWVLLTLGLVLPVTIAVCRVFL